MKQVWVKSATCSCTRDTTRGAAFPTDTTAIPEPKSISWLPSTSTMIPPPARSTYTGNVVPTPDDTAAFLRACNSTDRGPGIAVASTRFCSTVMRSSLVGCSEPAAGRVVGEALREPYRDDGSDDEDGGHNVHDRRLVGTEQVAEDPQRQGLDV